ncbi:MAG: hypothetical protein KDK66_03480 [Deltaproteobacteria bacterium]|nr:hypothetical protein [Deltaproteobacteria bacterium]
MDNIWTLSKLLSAFSDFPLGQDGKLDLFALGKGRELISKDICRIVSSLDEDFVYAIDVKDGLEGFK